MNESMKNKICAAALFLGCGFMHADEDDDPFAELTQDEAPQQIFVQQEWIELSTEDLTNLLFGEKLDRSGDDIRKEVETLIKASKAKVVESTGSIIQPHTSSHTKNVHQVIYATEYDPAEIHPKITAKDGKLIDRERIVPSTPTAFEERHIGTTSHIRAHDSGSEPSSLKCTFENKINSEHEKGIWTRLKIDGVEHNIVMPSFTQHLLNTSLTLKLGKTHLVSAFPAKNDAGKIIQNRKVIHFAKATHFKKKQIK